jgi:Fic family protein
LEEKRYKPPFTMTEQITDLIIEIGELTGAIIIKENLSTNPNLRRENRIRSIYSSLAIEQNTLTLEQVSDVINGRRVLGPPGDIREVKNAYEAYEVLTKLNPYSLKDLLKAHGIMMADLVEEAGRYRSKNVGVYSGTQLIHAGSPANYVPDLMSELFEWVKSSKLHLLIKSCIFHYEFEFIHPFSDGNGRTGRLWHTLILSKWKEFLLWLPIETLIKEQQEEYYMVLNAANTEGESTKFVEFMLIVVRDVLRELSYKTIVNADDISLEDKIISLLQSNGTLSAQKMAENLGISLRQVQRVMKQLKDSGKIRRVGANRNGHWFVS